MLSSLVKKRAFVASSIFLCILIPSSIRCALKIPKPHNPPAVSGMIDLRDWDFNRDGAVQLDGEWEFCRGRILNPSEFAHAEKREGCGYTRVPGLWKDHRAGAARLPGKGYATYRLKVLIGHDKKDKTIVIRRAFSSYRLWINGVLVDTRGNLDGNQKKADDYIFVHNRRYSSFTPVEGTNEITIQLFNNEYESGGIDRSIMLEDTHASLARIDITRILDFIVSGMLFFAAVYNILFYFSRKDNTVALYLGLLCLVLTLNTINHQIPLIPGGFPFTGNPYFVNYLTVILTMFFFMMLFRSLFPDEFSILFFRFSLVVTILLMTPLFFVGFRIAEQIMHVYFLYMVIFIVYDIFVSIRAIINRRDDAILFLVGFTPCFIGAMNDVLYAMWLINTTNVGQYGMLVLCITATIVVSRRFSRALTTVEELSRDLAEKNVSLRKLDQIKDQFLANTSHELRTPLHGMIGLTESLIDGATGSLPPRAIENLSLIASSGHRLASMVNDLLDMAKIQDEGLSLNLRPVDLYSLGEMVIKLSLPLAGSKPLEIVNSIDPSIPRACADEDRIRQVLYNLVGNAIKFTNNGIVELSAVVVPHIDPLDADNESRWLEVRVSDTGIGVPDEYREKIFEAYRQVDEGDTRAYSGTGLGLAIAKQIIEMHGGTIGVASGTGGGSVFSFTLPVSTDQVTDARSEIIIGIMDETTAPDTGSAEDEARLYQPLTGENTFENNPVFLVVDDDPVNVRIIKNYFETKNCTVRTAHDGISALDCINRDAAIDLVLLDIMMPGMSGFEVCRRIRAARSPENLPVIMLTAKNMMSDIDAAFEAGANDYIVKPFRISELLARVSLMLKLRNIRKSSASSITIHSGNSVYSFLFSEIIYITAHSKHIAIHTGETDIEVPVLLKEVIDRLPPDIFIRIHKSHIININYIHSVFHVLSGRYRVRLRDSDDTELPVGPSFLDSLRKKINGRVPAAII